MNCLPENYIHSIDLNDSIFLHSLKKDITSSLLKVLKNRESLDYIDKISLNSFKDLCLFLAIDFSNNLDTYNLLGKIHEFIYESALVFNNLKDSSFLTIYQEDVMDLIASENGNISVTYRLWQDMSKRKRGASDIGRDNFIKKYVSDKPNLIPMAEDFFDNVLLKLLIYSVPKSHLYNLAYIYYIHTYLERQRDKM